MWPSEHESSYLSHHGILGQKWGVRRFQNEDGTRTEAGKKRYNKFVEESSKQKKMLKERGKQEELLRRKYKLNELDAELAKMSDAGLETSTDFYKKYAEYDRVESKIHQEVHDYMFEKYGKEYSDMVAKDQMAAYAVITASFIATAGAIYLGAKGTKALISIGSNAVKNIIFR